MDLLLNFIVQLPEYCCQNQTFQHILVVIDWLTKRQIYEPFETLATIKFIAAMYKRVFLSYKFSTSIVNDQKNLMSSVLWKQLCQRFGINIKFFLAYHLEIDGQTENVNKLIKNYLQSYISYLQDNWIDHL